MHHLTRITMDPEVMGRKACIRGLRVTVGNILGMLAAGASRDEILDDFPYIEPEDIDAALKYAAWRVQVRDVHLTSGEASVRGYEKQTSSFADRTT